VAGVADPRPSPEVVATATLTRVEVAEVLALTEAAADADGTHPLSEHVRLHLRHGGEPLALHLLARHGSELVGYAHVDTTDPVDGAAAELCVHPLFRRRGLGRALVLRALAVAAEQDPAQRLRLWAHGDHPSATALALSLGFERFRVLWQLRRSLLDPVPAPVLPSGVTVRAFVPGTDDEAWLAVNARAFANHPEQGRWASADLRARLAEDWFDPAGFLMAWDQHDRLIGFHWTKVHGWPSTSDSPADHHHPPIGEVYVIGVDPAGHGQGLGTALTLAGLHYLKGRGLDQVMLYVDDENAGAARLYRQLGFARWATDVCFRFPAPDGSSPRSASA
jgi:mycothiol synthase